MKGVYTALITPFNDDFSIDYKAIEKLLEQQAAAGIDGIVVSGTTGESPTLKWDEKKKLIEFVKTRLQGTKVKTIAGTGTNDTASTIEASMWASSAGVDAVLLVAPYYNKPTQPGMLAHFKSVADQVACEVILYNVPSRTGSAIAVETVVELAQHPRIRSIKEATGSVELASSILLQASRAKTQIDVLCGDDATYFPVLCVGGHGVISVASHVCPTGMVALQKAVEAGDLAQARALHQRYFPVFQDLFIETNPAPVKWIMSQLGFGDPRMRRPLAPLTSATAQKLETLMGRYAVKNGELV